jgi:membrane dipeptidase
VFAANLGVRVAHSGPAFTPVPYVSGMENPMENFFNIIGWLVKNGYSDDEIEMVTGGNILRVLEKIW